MNGSKEYRLAAFVNKTAWPELLVLQVLGGRGLRRLATDIYAGFGMYPGREEELSTHLTKLPMAVIGHAPTFIYEHKGLIRPLLEPVKPYSSGSIVPTMWVGVEMRREQIGFKNTRSLAWFVRGAERLHRRVHVNQLREDLYEHIVRLSKETGLKKGIVRV